MTVSAPLRLLRTRDGFNVRAVLPNVGALADDVEVRGLLEPITVRAKYRVARMNEAEMNEADGYEIVSGHRRHAALLRLQREKRSIKVPSGIARIGSTGNTVGVVRVPRLVDGEFPVPIRVVEMTDEEALLANLAENAHKEGMRQVDVYARATELLDGGQTYDVVAQALAVSRITLEKRASMFRRLCPEIVRRWREIEEPSSEPPWSFLGDVARGTIEPGKRGGIPGYVAPTTAAQQLSVWRKLFGEDVKGSEVVRLREPAWRERHHQRGVRELRSKEQELRARAEVEIAQAGTLLAAASALAWAQGKKEAP